MRLMVKQLKELIATTPDDFVVRVGSDEVHRFDYLEAVGEDNDIGTVILYFES